MALIDRLSADMKEALKARETERLSTVRLLLSDLKTEQINRMRALSEEEEVDFLSRQAKRRRESIDSYGAGGRTDLADKEKSELAVIETYLPSQMSPEEATAAAAECVAASGARDRKEIGKVMALLMPRLKGRFPGKDVRPIVEKLLDGQGG